MTGRWRVPVLGLAVLALVAALWLRPAAEPAADPGRTAQSIAATLRCPTCAGESAADSAAPAARGMRTIIAERLAAGEEPEEIRAFFVERYGEWILLDPPRRGVGWALVVLPGVALTAGVVAVGVLIRRRRAPVHPRLTDAERRQAEQVVAAWAGRGEPPGPPGHPSRADEERLEATVQLLGDVRADAVASGRSSETEDDLLAEVLRLSRTTPDDAAAAVDGDPPPRRTAAGGPPSPGRLRPLVPLLLSAAVVGGVVLAAVRAHEPAVGSEQAGAAVAAPTGGSRAAADVLLGQARALDDAGRFDEAATAYRAVLEERPDAPGVVLALAFALVRADRPEEAVPLMRGVLDAHPDHPEALLVLGTAEQALGRPSARATLRRFLELAPEHPAAGPVRSLLEGP